MDKFDRIYQLHSILDRLRVPVSLTELMEALQCSKSKAYRLVATLRDHLGGPIELDQELGDTGARERRTDVSISCPACGSLQSLVVLQKLMTGVTPGLLESHLAPLCARPRAGTRTLRDITTAEKGAAEN